MSWQRSRATLSIEYSGAQPNPAPVCSSGRKPGRRRSASPLRNPSACSRFAVAACIDGARSTSLIELGNRSLPQVARRTCSTIHRREGLWRCLLTSSRTRRFRLAEALTLALRLAAATGLAVVAPAVAATPRHVLPTRPLDPMPGTCVIVVVAPPGPADPAPGGQVGPAGPGPAGLRSACKPDGVGIPCQSGNSWWSNALYCYIELANPAAATVRSNLGWSHGRRDLHLLQPA